MEFLKRKGDYCWYFAVGFTWLAFLFFRIPGHVYVLIFAGLTSFVVLLFKGDDKGSKSTGTTGNAVSGGSSADPVLKGGTASTTTPSGGAVGAADQTPGYGDTE